MTRICCALLCSCLVAADAHAQAHTPPPDSVRRTLEPLVATVVRPVLLGSAAGLRVDLDSVATPPAVSLGQLIREMPLIRARVNSRGETHLTLRGSESRQVSVTLDGIPLTIGWDNRTDLSVIPLTGARRVSAVRGLSSLLAGPNVLGGEVAISVAPLEAPGRAGTTVRGRGAVAGGAAAAFDLGLGHALGFGAGEGVLSAGGGYRSRDYMPLAAGVNQGPQATPGQRLNSDFRQWNAFLAGRWQSGSGTWLSASSLSYGAERGVPPELHVQEPRRWRLPTTRRWVTVVGAGTGWRNTGSGSGSLGVRAAADFGRAEIEEYETLAYERVVERELGDDRTLTLKVDGAHTLGEGTMRLSVTGAETRHDETLEPGGEARYRQRFLSVAAESELPLGGTSPGAFGLVLGLAADGSDTPETGGRPARPAIWDWGAKVAGTYALAGGRTRAHAGLSRRTRAPALRELYSGALGRFVVNPDLGPETLAVAEIGLTSTGPRSAVQLVGFFQRLSNAIVRVGTGDGRFQRVNRDEVSALGLEIVASAAWRGIDVQADLTLQNVKLNDPTAPGGQREPEYQPAVAGSFEVGGRLPLDLLGSLRIAHVGTQYCVDPDLERDVRLGAATWGDVELSRSWRVEGSGFDWLRLVGGVHNVTDASVYDQCGLPAAGRRLILGLEIG